jgi:catechol 2,3-dioxygenase-like lactoylglutathione lyase family enzyme
MRQAKQVFQAEPFVFVSDLPRSIAYWRDTLGFEVVTTYGDPPYFALLERAGARLALRHVDTPVIDPARRDAEELLSAAITSNDISGLYAEFSSGDVSFFRHLHTAPWGARTFIVRDPDGNLVLFAG